MLFNINKDVDGLKIDRLTKAIKVWAENRNLHTADPHKQTLKLGEEFGELCEGLVKHKKQQTYDSIGDIYIVLVILSIQLEVDIEDCIEMAYEEIKNRKGVMRNGTFVKEEDLNVGYDS